MIKIGDLSDFVFPRYFFTHESEFSDNVISKYLSLPVYVRKTGQNNTVEVNNDAICIQQPTSISMFLFYVLQNIISRMEIDQTTKDSSTIAIMMLCYDYINADEHPFFPFEDTIFPVKRIPEFKIIIDDVLQPVVGKIDAPHLCFVKSPILDVCKVALDDKTLHQYAPDLNAKKHHFPLIICNTAIANKAALMSHILEMCIKTTFGSDKHATVVKKILVSENGLMLDYITSILKTFYDDPLFILDFLRYTESSVVLDQEMVAKLNEIKSSKYSSDLYFGQSVKTASPLMSVNHDQWTQTALFMGLIEQQLNKARGSKWPATHRIKPREDRLRAKMIEMKNEKKKKNLNFEELLEAARSMYNHKSNEPSKVLEVYLKRNRDWH